MPSGNYNSNFSAGGVSISSLNAYTADGAAGWEVDLPVGLAGTLSTRTDDNTGIATLSSGHGITLGQNVDVHWDGGCRYGMDTPVVGATTVSLEGGSGDALPTAATAIVVTPQVIIATTFDAAGLAAIGIMARITAGTSGVAHAAFYNSDSEEVSAFYLTGGVMVFQDDDTNTFGDQTNTDIAFCLASNGTDDQTMTLQIALLEDTTL